MSEEKDKAVSVVTPEARCAFVHILEPSADLEGRMKYSISLLFTPDIDIAALRKAAGAAAKAKYGDKIPKDLTSPFLVAKDKESFGDWPDGTVLVRASATAKSPPGVVDRKLKAITDPREIYSGIYGKAELRAFVYETQHPQTKAVLNRGVSFGLQNFQKTRDGENMTGRRAAQDVFSALEGEESAFGEAADAADSVFG